MKYFTNEYINYFALIYQLYESFNRNITITFDINEIKYS